MSLDEKIYCYNCNKAVMIHEHKDPDFTTWRCPLCDRVLDRSFTDDEMEWEDEDSDE